MARTPNGRLDSWKEVAEYLHRDISTAVRWSKERGLPVHRVPGGRRQAVFAYSEEIDAWLASDAYGGTPSSTNSTPAIIDQRGGASVQETPLQSDSRVLSYRVPLLVLVGTLVAGVLGLSYYLGRPLVLPKALGYTEITDDGRIKLGGIVTDGARLYFAELTPSGYAVVQVSTSGGEVTPLSTFFTYPMIQNMDRNHSEVLVLDRVNPAMRAPVWALPVAGGLPRRVGNILADAAAWSPDGNTIVYSAGDDLYFCKSDGSESRRIVSTPGKVASIHWSPDGRRLRISVNPPEKDNAEIWEVRADGANLHPFSGSWPDSGHYSVGPWTPDGKHFLFSLLRENRTDVWTLWEEHGILGLRNPRPIPLTAGPLDIGGFAPSPDGRRLFLVASEDHGELLRYDMGSKQFVRCLPGVSADQVDFSSDGQWMAYVLTPGNVLWKRRSGGKQPLQLTVPPLQTELPRWSPDGKWIAFMGLKDPSDVWQVYLIPADGGEYEPVMPTTVRQGAPTWSPDGKRLAFGDLLENSRRPVGQSVIHIVDATTRQATTLPGSRGLWTARWSPDGRHIAALTEDSRSLMVFDFATGKWVQLASASSISDLNWSRKGEAIYFEDPIAPGGPAIFRVRLHDREVEQVASLASPGRFVSPWMGVAADDSILIYSQTGISEIYALDLQWP